MEWSATSATNAFLDTLKLCGDHERRYNSWKTPEPECNEFISALAAGTKSKLIVEVTSGASPCTIALAAAARQTGGRLVCILPEPTLAESKKVIKDSGLKDMVEFRTEDPFELLPNYENVDFSLVDCERDNYKGLLNLLDVNPSKSVVVANNLDKEGKGLGGHVGGKKGKVSVRSTKCPIGKGMEVTMIGDEFEKRDWRGGGSFKGEKRREGAARRRGGKSKWVCKVDQESGEEHIFRVPKSL
ncbi:hypothetical protein L1049_013047 [Liquidambar formosana]|uniref:S-adenosyl-L-methionine-dependent methyltransferase n=1 Tax=Liquidambar formosana TaxID=63359 RepID=A0AAP0WXC6_LIQFO